MNPDFQSQPVVLDSQIQMIVNEIHDLAVQNGFPAKTLEEIDLIVSELASNHIKHNTVQGRIHFRVADDEEGTYLEIISEDKGPGIPDSEIVFEDGFTTAEKSMGVGLGSVKRFSDTFSISSSLSGTMMTLKKYAEKRTQVHSNGLRISVLTRPHPLESVCGDGYYVERFSDGALVAVIDGLGHGVYAREASACAEKYLRSNARHSSIDDLLFGLGSVLRKTRGAVAGLVRIDVKNGKVYYGGIGDISARLYQGNKQSSFLSKPGILGMHYTRVEVQSGDWTQGKSMLIVHSDGISTRYNLDSIMADEKPQTIAHYIMDTFWRKNDDGTVVVIK